MASPLVVSVSPVDVGWEPESVGRSAWVANGAPAVPTPHYRLNGNHLAIADHRAVSHPPEESEGLVWRRRVKEGRPQQQ